ncbi:unnamed protein product [Brassica oleracea]
MESDLLSSVDNLPSIPSGVRTTSPNYLQITRFDH